jgi:hypothetical protein
MIPIAKSVGTIFIDTCIAMTEKITLKDLVNFVKSVPINYPKTSPGVDYFPISLPTKIP